MSWWRRWFGGQGSERETPSDEQLFPSLMAAVSSGDAARFEALCKDNRDRIVALAPSWRTMPEELRSNPEAVQRWGETLVTTMRYLADVLGDSRMLDLLSSGAESPLPRWQADHTRALELAAEQKYTDAVALLEGNLEEMRRWHASEQILNVTEGMLGQIVYHSGDVDGAQPILERVHERCIAENALDGAKIYGKLLCDIHRYRDRGEQASRLALRVADTLEALGEDKEAASFRARAARWPRGEPLLRVALRIKGEERLFERDEISLLPVGVRIEAVFVRGRPTLQPALALTEAGRAVDGPDANEERITLFERAARADPLDPDSRYQLAFTLLLEGKVDRAMPLQEEVERLAPGWFHNRAWLSLSRRLLEGLSREIVPALHVLDDGGLSPEQRLDLASRVILQMPRVAQLHLHRGRALRALGRLDEAQISYRAGLEVAGDDLHTQSDLLAELAACSTGAAARSLWQQAAAEGGNRITQAFAEVALAQSEWRPPPA